MLPISRPHISFHWLSSVAIGLLALITYVITLYPDLTGGDSGELAAAVANGGVIHPPGYPLYFILGKLFVQLPFGTLAWRMGLLSACCDALAAAILCFGVSHWTRSSLAGFAAAGLFAWSPGVWRYAIRPEVFALNNFLLALLLLLTITYSETKDNRYALAGAFVCGLGLSNHHTYLFTALPLAIWALWTARGALLNPRTFSLLTASFVAGLLPYLVLPIAGAHPVLVSWGSTNTWVGFWRHVLRSEYGTFQLAVTGVGTDVPAVSILGAWFEDLILDIGWCGALLALVGAAALLRSSDEKPPGPSKTLLFSIAAYVAVFAGLANLPVNDPVHRAVVSRFWQQPELLICTLCAFGLTAIKDRFEWRWLLPVAALGLVSCQIGLNGHEMDEHANRLERRYAEEIMRIIPSNALLLTRGDFITNSLRYLQVAERRRPDVRVLDQELMGFEWSRARLLALHPEVVVPGERLAPGITGGYSAKDLIDSNIGRAPVIVCGGFKFTEAAIDTAYTRLPLGICERIYPPSNAPAVKDWLAQSDAALPRIEAACPPRTADRLDAFVCQDFWNARKMQAVELFRLAGFSNERALYYRRVAEILDRVTKAAPKPSPLDFKMLATAIGLAGLDTADNRRAAAEAWHQYLRVAPESDPMLPAIRQEVQRLDDADAHPQ